jgi:hypothetical protein
VFGYASLVLDEGGRGTVARLPGYRRVWGVATDNLRAIPGYKMYLDRSDGSRPAVYVAFVDIDPDPSSVVNGVVRPVSEAELELLDLRERNYDRVDVSGQMEGQTPVRCSSENHPCGARPIGDRPALLRRCGCAPPLEGRVWTYRGSPEGRERLRRGRAEGRAVVSRDYLEKVLAGFAALGPEQERAFAESSCLDDLPVADLERLDLPAEPPPARHPLRAPPGRDHP